MSCNGCRVLRKGCSDSCILRSSLLWIDSPEAQGHATVFVAKFFGRAGMISFINAVPESQRPALFQSLLYEACGRTVNPVFGAVGLLWSGNWAVCQAAVETVLKGGTLKPSSALGNPSIINPYANAPVSMKFGIVEKLPPSSSSSSPLLLHPNPNPNPNPNLNPSPSLDPNPDADSADPHPNPPPKRPRSSPPLPDAQCSALPEPKLENQNANPHHASSPLASESEQASSKEVSAPPSLIAPVARRLRPLVLPGHSLPCGPSNTAFVASGDRPSSSSSSGNLYHDPSSVLADRDNNHHHIESMVKLDLTLSSSLAKSSSGSITHSHGSPPTYYSNRVSSPCSFSEGSETTSLDTAELSAPCFRAALSPQGPLGEEPQLLKLL